MVCIECNIMHYGVQRVAEISTKVQEKLLEVKEFLCVKALQSYVLGSVFKEINGLVHFIHINRSSGRIIVPTIDLNSKRGTLIKNQVSIFINPKREAFTLMRHLNCRICIEMNGKKLICRFGIW